VLAEQFEQGFSVAGAEEKRLRFEQGMDLGQSHKFFSG
jgi:hypothetical protein